MDWKSIKQDISKGIKDGVEVVLTGADVAAKKAGELTAEGKKRFKIYTIKKDIHELMADLGARFYKIRNEASSPLEDSVIKSILKKIDAKQAELTKAEEEKSA
ncbi:MAG: hypothetical protein JNL74_16600 [Fibrobacteres bacterium]|nr:hypothetical protein [Fibrobacterota bacterium]